MPDSLFSVDGQVVVVSGGSRGIGRAIANGFAERGATVVITGREQLSLDKAAEELVTNGFQAHAIVCDVLNRNAIDSAVNQILSKFGRIDTLVNVAGVNRRKPALEVTEDDYDFVLDVNLKGAFL